MDHRSVRIGRETWDGIEVPIVPLYPFEFSFPFPRKKGEKEGEKGEKHESRARILPTIRNMLFHPKWKWNTYASMKESSRWDPGVAWPQVPRYLGPLDFLNFGNPFHAGADRR